MKIVYYVTGHGYGHSLRACQVINALPAETEVVVKTPVESRFFDAEVRDRRVKLVEVQFDCGCVQSDSLTVIPAETLERYRSISRQNDAQLGSEIEWLQSENVDGVVSDVPSWPLYAAKSAGIPSAAVANFTWHSIYTPLACEPWHVELLDEMQEQYLCANVCLVPGLAVHGLEQSFRKVVEIPIIARHGISRRTEIESALSISPGSRICLLYFGSFGLDINWAGFEAIEGWSFLTYGDGGDLPSNVHTLNGTNICNGDVAASVDCVMSKAGYGTVSECMANSVPLIHVSRDYFVETAALEAGITEWRGGIEMPQSVLLSGDVAPYLRRVDAAKSALRSIQCNGAEVASSELMRLFADASAPLCQANPGSRTR